MGMRFRLVRRIFNKSVYWCHIPVLGDGPACYEYTVVKDEEYEKWVSKGNHLPLHGYIRVREGCKADAVKLLQALYPGARIRGQGNFEYKEGE